MSTRARRIGTERSATRAAILDMTEKLMVEEGYAAVSTRRVAAEAGVKAPLVHYYFPTTDDLFITVYRRAVDKVMERLEEALASRQPLRALWNFASDPSRNALAVELMALANHRKAIREEIALHTERTRQRQAEALATLVSRDLVDPAMCPPVGLALVMVGIARALTMESSFGITLGHAEARAFVERWIREQETRAEPQTATGLQRRAGRPPLRPGARRRN